MNQSAFLYSITNALDGMMYIGVTKNPKVRFRSHSVHNTKTRSIIKAAIKKHGVKNFKMDILCEGTQDYCYEMEAKAIEIFNTRKPNGYNICSGGRGSIGLVGEDNGMYGRVGELHPHYGKPGYRTGIPHTEETKAKMSSSRIGKKRSLESKEKMRQTALNRSPELKEKIKLAMQAGLKKKKDLP